MKWGVWKKESCHSILITVLYRHYMVLCCVGRHRRRCHHNLPLSLRKPNPKRGSFVMLLPRFSRFSHHVWPTFAVWIKMCKHNGGECAGMESLWDKVRAFSCLDDDDVWCLWCSCKHFTRRMLRLFAMNCLKFVNGFVIITNTILERNFA